MATKLRPPPPPKPPTSPAKLRQAALHESRHNPVDTTALNVGLNGLSGLNGTSDSNGNNNGAGAQPTINTSATSSQPPSLEHESVVMTPRGKTANSTVILIERKLIERIGDRQHVAGGDHAGIIINKDAADDRRSDQLAPQLSLEFRVFLVSGQTGDHSQESRTLRFWFRDWLTDGDRQAHVAQEFFRELVAPKEFPRGEISWIWSRRWMWLFMDVISISIMFRLRWLHQEDNETDATRLQRNPRPRSGAAHYGENFGTAVTTT